jgi:hypothetical protein
MDPRLHGKDKPQTFTARCTGFRHGFPETARIMALLAVLFFGTGETSFASESPEITVSADRAEARIGDRINLEVASPARKGVQMIFPERPDETGDFSFISSELIKTGPFREKREGRVYTYSIYRTGTHVIPPVKVLYKTEEDTEWKSIFSRQVSIEVMSVLDPEDASDIRDIRGILNPARRVKTFLAAILILAAIMALLALWIRKRKREAIEASLRARPPHEIAYERLSELRSMKLPEKGLIKEYYIRLSEIVRYYLEGRFFFRAPEMTTEEFLESLRGSPKLKEEHKELLKEFLSHCDMVKFAKYGPTPLEILDSFSSAERLVEQTRALEGDESE